MLSFELGLEINAEVIFGTLKYIYWINRFTEILDDPEKLGESAKQRKKIF